VEQNYVLVNVNFVLVNVNFDEPVLNDVSAPLIRASARAEHR
jgi:hypothetical protein